MSFTTDQNETASSASRTLRLDPAYELWRSVIFVSSWLCYFGFYLTRKSFSVAKVELVKPDVMGWSKTELASLDTINLTAYAVGGFICGMLGDRFGARKVLAVGVLASVIAAVSMGASSKLLVFGAMYAIQGLCQSAGWAPITKNLAAFFSQRERGGVMGWWCTSYAAGGFVGTVLAGFMAQQFGWRSAFWMPAGALFVIWLFFLVFQRNRPEDVGLPPIEQYHGEPEAVIVANESPSEEQEGSWHVVWEVLQNKMVLLLALVYFLVKMPRYLFLFWAPLYVNERLGTGAFASGVLGSLYDIATPLGVLLGGYLTDRLYRSKRIPLCVMGLVGTALIMFAFGSLPATRWAIGVALFGVGLLLNIPDSLISSTAAVDFGTKKGASTAAGFINSSGSIGAILGVGLPGWIDRIIAKGQDPWLYVFCSLGTALVLAAVLLIPKWNELPPEAK